MPPARPDRPSIEAVRAFNRFYTRQVGALGAAHLGSRYSLTEVRVLYELACRDAPGATELATELGLDPGYLSRILRRFVDDDLVRKTRADGDGRRSELRLTRRGELIFEPLDRAARDQVGALLAALPAADRARLLAAMRTIQAVLDPAAAPARAPALVLRDPRPGELGWVIARHGAVYADEHGYDVGFEALVAKIVADFAADHDPARERCWIADADGEPVGSVFLVAQSRTIAKLRLLLVEPQARGHGLGAQLVGACVGFARAAGYRRLVLWTQAHLHGARKLYEAAGFRRTASEPHRSWGRAQVSETWQLDLR